MSFLEPEELRYLAMSMFALIIITSMLTFTGAASQRYEPSRPMMNATNESAYWIDNFSENDFLAGTVTDEFKALVRNIIKGFAFIHNVYASWETIIVNGGWASAFIAVPSAVIFLIGTSAFLKIIGVLPYT